MEDSSMQNGETGAELDHSASQHDYDFDLFVIGGGSGGLAWAFTAQDWGARVGLADFVKPSPQGTTWKVGGTWVNVGWIPKKMMHYAGLLGEGYHDEIESGWKHTEKPKHNWEKMISNINNHIRSINFGYKKDMKNKKITFYEEYASFIDAHTVELVDIRGKTHQVTSKYFVIAVGGRPQYPEIPGAKEYGITSDDIFWMKKDPGKTLVIGASYVALEWAGFLHSFGNDTTVMVRSIFLRGFDQDIANKIAKDMENLGVKFIGSSVPTKITKDETTEKLTVYYQTGEVESSIEVDTVLFAIGRYAVTEGLNLKNAGLVAESNGKFITDKYQRTNVSNIYAIGDVIYGKLELTPTAIHTGRLLARRLFQGSETIMDFVNVPTTVFTPLEYGWVGYSEEDAIKEFGDTIKVYHTFFQPLEWQFDKMGINGKRQWYTKVIVNTADNKRVVGFHILSPNAGEITQGMGIAFKSGLTKDILDECIGIHPTVAEEVTDLHIDKADNPNPIKTSCWS